MTWSNGTYWSNGTTSVGTYWPLTVTSGSGVYSTPYTVTPPPEPRARTPLEWLDAEIERTCAKARLAA